jgi:hypothetical protein
MVVPAERVLCRLGRGICCSGGGFWGRGGSSGAGARVPEAGAEAVLLVTDCCHMAVEVLNLLQKSGVVGGWTSASDRRLGCDLGDTVRTVGCGVKPSLVLTDENGLYVGVAGWTKWYR